MPKGQYDRTKIVRREAPVEAVKDEVKQPAPVPPQSFMGRNINRVMLHNGVSVPRNGGNPKIPASMTIEKGLFRAGADIPKPPNRQHAVELYVVPFGVYARYGDYEKIIPWANVYEADLDPA